MCIDFHYVYVDADFLGTLTDRSLMREEMGERETFPGKSLWVHIREISIGAILVT